MTILGKPVVSEHQDAENKETNNYGLANTVKQMGSSGGQIFPASESQRTAAGFLLIIPCNRLRSKSATFEAEFLTNVPACCY